MKKLGLSLAAILVAMNAFSQSMPANDQRLRIQAERMEKEPHYQIQETQCYARFAVTDCLNEVRSQRRAVLHELRRQEITLNNAERQQKAQEQLERIRQKSSAESP